MQNVLIASDSYTELDEYFTAVEATTVLLVCGSSIGYLKLNDYFGSLEKRKGIKVVRFSDFQPNPSYCSVVTGVDVFHKNKCDIIVAIGGGSAIDVAKCIKLYSNMPGDGKNGEYLKQEIIPNDIPFLAIPTTAGTGSEATKYAVVYYGGEKQSVTHESCIPSTVLFDADVLKTLPLYQKKATMMDAFCHCIESFWSINRTDESKSYSKDAIRLILENMDGYLSNNVYANANMLKAANIAGKAINIAQTTAGHAMCYKLTSLYGIAHGHAAALCVKELFPYMIARIALCTDESSARYLDEIFTELAIALDCENARQAADKFAGIVDTLGIEVPKANIEDIKILKNAVNPTRLKNNPVSLSLTDIENIYRIILKVDE